MVGGIGGSGRCIDGEDRSVGLGVVRGREASTEREGRKGKRWRKRW